MSDIISDSISKLSVYTDKTCINWDAFDSVLKELEDINAFDDQYKETILSEFLKDGYFYNRGTIIVDIVNHFISCGYDVSANNGLNGILVLDALCWSSYDKYILEAAKILLNAGAPVDCITDGSDINDESDGLLETIEWKLSGAWMVDNDYTWANILGAYYELIEAKISGKDYNSVDSYFACIGKPLTSVYAINVDGKLAIHNDGNISIYSEPLIVWFNDKPLVISRYTDFVMNPVYVHDNVDSLVDVSEIFSSLIGATLQEVQFIDAVICYFEFSNDKRLFFASHDIGDRKRIGTFDIRNDNGKVDVEQLNIKSICTRNGNIFDKNIIEYSEDAVALLCNDEAYFLYPQPGKNDRYKFGICPCNKSSLSEYIKQYPLQQPSKTTWIYDQGDLSALRIELSNGYLYMVATEYYGIEITLSDKIYNPLEYFNSSDEDDESMEYWAMEEDD